MSASHRYDYYEFPTVHHTLSGDLPTGAAKMESQSMPSGPPQTKGETAAKHTICSMVSMARELVSCHCVIGVRKPLARPGHIEKGLGGRRAGLGAARGLSGEAGRVGR